MGTPARWRGLRTSYAVAHDLLQSLGHGPLGSVGQVGPLEQLKDKAVGQRAGLRVKG